MLSLRYLNSNCRKSIHQLYLLTFFRQTASPTWIKERFFVAKVHRFPISKFHMAKTFSSRDDCESSADDVYSMDELTEFEGLDVDKTDLKEILYPNSTDTIIKELNSCTTFEQFFQIFEAHRIGFTAQHFTQSVLVLWGFLRQKHKLADLSHTRLLESQEFEQFVKDFADKIDVLTPDELTCIFLYLDKLEVDAAHSTMQAILLRIMDKLSDDSADFPLTALSRFCVCVHSNEDLYTFLVCKDVMPRVIHYIKICKSAEEIRLITICLHHLHEIATNDTMRLYKEKINELIDSGVINKTSTKCILKILNFLNFPHWSFENSTLMRKLTLLFSDTIDDMQGKDLIAVFRVFQSQLEPATLVPKLSRAAEKHFHENPSPELLVCAVQFTQPNRRKEMTEKIQALLNESEIMEKNSKTSLPALFKALRILKISNTRLCNKYWSLVLSEIMSNPEEQKGYRIARYCHRYMHFNNNLGGTYRHIPFEKKLVQILQEELKTGISSFVPSKFAKLASFLFAYGHTERSNVRFPEFVVDKIEAMSKQFSIFDCLQISRGLQIALEMRFRNYLPPDLAAQLVRIDNVLNSCAERHLKENLTIGEINCLIRSFHNRKASRNTQLYQNAIQKYVLPPNEINSRVIRDISFNLLSSNYLMPQVCNDILNYIVKNREYVTGDTVEKVLNSCYNLGHVFDDNEVLHWSAEIIKRDFEYMTGLSIVQACLALCFYKSIPESLINKVFSIEFIQRLEEEIQTCYSKATYPERVLNQVMQLNRAICLDYPESRVPWFQQNYIEAQMTKLPVITSKFHSEVESVLTSFVNDKKLLRTNHVTPYGYRIDFVLHFDQKRKLIQPPSNDVDVITKISKVAILLLKLESFCENELTSMKGPEHLKMRHLEMLGYKVIHINLRDWNSMYMNVPGAKVNYLKGLLDIR